MSTVSGFASALAANICEAVDAPLAFCFARDIETEQFLGAYSARGQAHSEEQRSVFCKEDEGRAGASGTGSRDLSANDKAPSGLAEAEAVSREELSLRAQFKRHPKIEAGRGRSDGSFKQGPVPIEGLNADASAFFSFMLARDAQDSNTCTPGSVQTSQGARPSVVGLKRSFHSQDPNAMYVKPSTMQLPEAEASQSQEGEAKGAGDQSPQCLPPFDQPEVFVVSSDGVFGNLLKDLTDGVRAYAYNPVSGRLSPLGAKESSVLGEDVDAPLSRSGDEAKCIVVACRLENDGARSAFSTMADARVTYVGPACPRKSTGFCVSPHRAARVERAIVATQLASTESTASNMEAARSFPRAIHSSARRQGSIPVLFSATLEASAPAADEDSAARPQPTSPRSPSTSTGGLPLLTSPRTASSKDISVLPTQADERHLMTTPRSHTTPPGRSPRSWRFFDDPQHQLVPSPSSSQGCNAPSFLGVIFCVNAKAVDAHLLIEALAEVCCSPLALLLQQQWLRRDRFKRMLQLELHRTVFQETSIPIRMMQRFLALLHTAVGAEAASFYIVDAQDRNFICLGGHKRAMGLRLSRSHKLLGESTRHGGKTVVLNFLPPGFNKEYDNRAHFETKHAMLIPLLNTQGHVKAVVVLMNRQQCTCERLVRLEESGEAQCTCVSAIRSLEPSSLALDAWSTAAAPCEKCIRKREGELSYGEFITKPPTLPSWLPSALFPCLRCRTHEMLMRAVQCEMQHFLGGQLTNVCMAGLSLLQPMETMVSYVMADQQRGGRNDARPFGAVMAQIENFVLRDRRLKLLSLRRCESVAATEPGSPRSLSDVHTACKAFGRLTQRGGSRLQHSFSIGGYAVVGSSKRRPVLPSIQQSGKPDQRTIGTQQKYGDDFCSPHRDSQTSLPVAPRGITHFDSGLDSQAVPLFHSSSAPLEVSCTMRQSSKGNLVSLPTDLESMKASEVQLAIQRRRTASVPALVFSAALEKCGGPFDAIRKQLSLEPYRRLDLNVWQRSAEELELFFFLALEELGIMVKKEKASFQAFFRLIRDAYHTDNPYHNFYHAIHVTQMCWLFLTRYSCRNALSPTEQLGLLLAALAHDVDHPGVNNSSLCGEQHPLAIVYNDKAVLENHHAAFAARTMMQLGMFSRPPHRREACASADSSLPRGRSSHCLSVSSRLPLGADQKDLASADVDDEPFYPAFTDIRRVLITCILSTDMELYRHHHEAMKTRAQMKCTTGESLSSDEDRKLLMTCLIHCADISNPLLPERRNVQWASLIVQEFNAQVEMERHKGLPVTVFMDARTELMRTQSQIGFLSAVVLDQFRALSDLVPGAEELVAQGEKNLEDWQSALDLLREIEQRET
ncbi:hypothetical protein Efla_002074 [Eimeria flavescens]